MSERYRKNGHLVDALVADSARLYPLDMPNLANDLLALPTKRCSS